MAAKERIPSLDLEDFLSGTSARKAKFVDAMGKGYEEFGFIALKNHGLSEKLTVELYRVSAEFFALPNQVKNKYYVEGFGGQIGYTPAEKAEHAKGKKVPDLKEYYMISQEIRGRNSGGRDFTFIDGPNVWPVEVSRFKEVALDVYRRLEDAGKQTLRALALYLSLDENYFDEKIHNGNSKLRLIYYPPILHDPGTAARSSEHEDINLITLLMGASAEGLEIKTRQGEWISVTSLPDQVVINAGDMLQRLTNYRLHSTTHRVVNPPQEKWNTPRYSAPFFLHPRPETDLTCLESCVSDQNPARCPPITAYGYLQERLHELGVIKK